MPSNIIDMKAWVTSRRETTIRKSGNIAPTPVHPYRTTDDGLCRKATGVKTRCYLQGFGFSDQVFTDFIFPVEEYILN